VFDVAPLRARLRAGAGDAWYAKVGAGCIGPAAAGAARTGVASGRLRNAIRALRVARRGAVKARAAALNQLQGIYVRI
jgi:hypothetical protein